MLSITARDKKSIGGKVWLFSGQRKWARPGPSIMKKFTSVPVYMANISDIMGHI